MQYDLWSELKVEVDGEKRTETFFVNLEITSDYVLVDVLPEFLPEHERPMIIKELDDITENLIEDKVAAGYKIFKDKEWV